jgi:hypothetical protein
MADEHISQRAVVNYEVGSMAYTSHCGNFASPSERAAPDGIGAKVARLGRRLTYALVEQRQREIARALARSGGRITDSMEREIMQKALASDWSLPQ